MSIVEFGGYRFGTKSKAVIMGKGGNVLEALDSPAKPAAVQPSSQEASYNVALWGNNNMLPVEMQADIENTDVLQAGIDTKARIAIGKGPVPARVTEYDRNGGEVLEFVADSEVNDWLDAHRAFETSFAIAKDLFGFGNAFVQILLSTDRKQIVAYKRMDPVQCRLSKVDEETGKSEWVYVSADWQQWYTADMSADTANKHITRVPLLDKDYPLLDLQSRTEGYSFMVCIQYSLTGRNYYSPAPWYSARQWAKISQSIPEMKRAMFKNQITLKYVVEIHDQFWPKIDPRYATATVEVKKAIQDGFYEQIDEYLTGGANQYKSLFSVTVVDRETNKTVPGITVTAIDDKIKDGKLLPDGATADTHILFALMLNPALVGVDVPGGGAVRTAGSGSNIRESYLLQILLTEAERKMNATIFNMAKAYNGWDKSIVLRFPNQVLTTLNTGANTEGIAA